MIRRLLLRIGFSALSAGTLLGWAPAASAQVNVEPFRAKIEEGEVGGRLGGSLTAYDGNTEGVILGAAGLVGTDQGRHFAFLAGSGDYSRLGGETTIAKTFAHARYNYELQRWLLAETFIQTETDQFRRIRIRQLFGLGPRLQSNVTEDLGIFYGTAYMLELTRRNDDVAADEVAEGWFHRWSHYGGFTLDADPATLHAVAYYQPRFDRFADYRALLVGGVDFKIGERLESSINVTYRYESKVPREVDRADLTIKNLLSYRF